MTTPTYSVVIPAYNSTDSLPELADRLNQVFTEVMDESYEIIFVDDGSTNSETWKILKGLSDRSYITAIRLMRNYGKPGAIMCGLENASGRWVITIDDDLQQLPEDIPRLTEYRDHDVVVGAIQKKEHGLWIRLSSRIKAKFDAIILGVPCPMSPLKLVRSEVVKGMLAVATSRPFIPALMSSVTNDFVSVPISHKKSRIRGSRYSFLKRFSQFSNLLIGNSTMLLRCIGTVGAITAISGFIFAAYTVIRTLLGDEVLPGWSSLIVINLVFGGLLLIALGINGEYLFRILENSSNKPAYVIRTKYNKK